MSEREIDYRETFHPLGQYHPALEGIDLLYYGNGRLSSNIYVLEEGGTLIDLGNFAGLVAELKEHYPQVRVERVIFTHAHFDHMGGLGEILSHWTLEVVIHKAELESVLPGGTTLRKAFQEMGIKEIRELEGNEEIELKDRKLRVLYTPGHTPGSVSLYDPESRVLFSGDTAFPMMGEEILLTAPDPHGGDLQELTESIRMLVHLEIQAMLPGHLFPVWENVREHLKRTYFELQIQLQGREDMALINSGILAADLGNLEEAIAFFDRVLEKAPNHPGACFTKGLAYYQMGRFKEAIELFDRALEVAPNFQEAQQARRMAAIALSGQEE